MADGRCFITMFLLNEESQSLIEKKRSTKDFVHRLEGCVTTDPTNPEGSPAFHVRTLFGRLGLSTSEPIHYGSWCGRDEFLSYQDVVIATKA